MPFALDYDLILSKTHTALEKVAVRIGEEMQLYLTEERRNYPRTTIRREGVGVTGKIARSPRDVVDTGELRDSFKITIERNSEYITIIIISWESEHAYNVYFGHGNVPPYPWIEYALRRIDLDKLVEEAFNE